MAKIGTGSANADGQVKTTEHIPVEVPKMSDGSIDYQALYDKIDAAKTTRVGGQALVSADEIREVIDGLFSTGKAEVAVATVADMVNVLHGLEKTDDHDTRVQNSSVRSAGTAGEKYEIFSIGTAAYFRKNASYDPNKPRKKPVRKPATEA